MTSFLRLPAVLDRVGLSRSEIYRMIQRGTFPKPVKLGPMTSAWPDDEIDEWMRERLAERDRESNSSPTISPTKISAMARNG